ncbi:MAG: trimethylamine methyltransferase family protein [Lachnospiraceae bacterium]|nr:trimethylamine methyltransferase family protein [Lachnospiraceae bacterium]
MKHVYQFATKEELDIIHEYTMKTLEEVGVKFCCEEALEIFRQHGFKTVGETVYMTEKDVMKALETTPKQFDWYGRSGHITVGDGSSICAPTYGPIFILEDGNFHPVEKRDFLNFVKLAATSPALDVSNPNLCDIGFMPQEVCSNWAQAAVMLHDTHPMIGMVDGKQSAIDSIKMAQDFLGIKDKPVVAGLISTSSPCHVSTAMCEALIEYSREGQIMFISSSSMPGLTCPGSLGSLLMLNNAEVLSTIVLTQLINAGVPVIYGIQSHGCDLRYMTPCVGSPEQSLIFAATKSLGNYYGLPVRTGGSSGDSKQVDMQAGAESFSTAFNTILSGADLVVHACGGMDQDCSLSYDKFIYDEEIILSCKRIMRGFEISEESMLFDCVKEAGPGGGFMNLSDDNLADSFDYYREETSVLNCATHMAHATWLDKGSQSVTDRTKAIYTRRLEEYRMPDVEKERFEVLAKYVPAELLKEFQK